MKINKITYISFVAILFTGCAVKTPLSYEKFIFPPIGLVTTKSIGEYLVEQGYGQIGPEIELLDDTKVGDKIFPKGKYQYYTATNTSTWFHSGNYEFYIPNSTNLLCVDGKICVSSKFTQTRGLIPGSLRSDSFQQSLLYNGKIGNKITIAYREFSNGIARPSFSNTVEYDLSESTTIGYKGVRIEVVKATNTDLTYRIISGFSQ